MIALELYLDIPYMKNTATPADAVPTIDQARQVQYLVVLVFVGNSRSRQRGTNLVTFLSK